MLSGQSARHGRLAAVARAGSHRPLAGDRPAEAVARRGPAGRLDGGQPRRRLRLDRRQRRPRLRAGHARPRRASSRALNRADGKAVWVASDSARRGDNDRGPGPRSTPTIDGDRVYVLTENGDLACLRVQDGTVVWQRNILSDFGGRNIQWLISESPLVDGNQVDRHARRPQRRHGGARQDDRQDDLDEQGAERRGRLCVADRRRRPGRPDAT